MKKTLLLAIALIMSLGAWAQGTTSNANCVSAIPTEASKQAYVLSTPRGTLIGTENQYLQATDLPANNTTYAYDKTNGAFQFLLFPVEGQTNGYYVYNVGTNKFLGTRVSASTKSGYNTGVAPMVESANKAVYYIWKHGQTGSTSQGYSGNFNKQDWPWTIGSSVRTSGNWNTINMTHWNNGVGYDFGSTGSLDGGNAYAIVPAENVSNEVYREAYYGAYGEYPSAATPEQISELQTKINVALGKGVGVGYPKADAAERLALNAYDSYMFTGVTADTYDDALAKYNAFLACTNITMPVEGRAYNILICAPNGTKYYLYRNNDGQLTTSTTEPVGNAAKFVASGIDGGNITFAVEGEYVQWFCTEASKCYNGNTKGLSATTNSATTLTIEKATATNFGSGNIEGATDEGLFGKLQIKGPGKTGTWYYNFRTDGAFISQYAGDKFYDDNWDNGASGLWRTCFFELQQTELIVNNAWTDLEETLALADEYIVGEGYGEYTLAEGDWATAIANAEAELNTHTTEANAEALNTTITDYIAALTLNVPAAGSFITIQNVHGTYLNGAATSPGVAARSAEPSLFFYNADGQLIGYPGGYVLNNGPAALLGASTPTYEFVKGTTKGKLAIKNSSNEYLMDWADGRLNMFGNIESTCNYTIGKGNALPVDFKSNGEGYATIYSPVALEIPTGVTAYVGTEEAEGSIKVSEIEDGIIPAKRGVVLYKEGVESNTTIEFPITTGGESTSCFRGTFSTMPASDEDHPYVFSIAGDTPVPGFYGFIGTNLAGFKAYYVAAGAPVQGFVLDFGNGVLTGIEGLQTAAPVKGAFDLQGRRVNAATRGLFIQNGVKVIR